MSNRLPEGIIKAVTSTERKSPCTDPGTERGEDFSEPKNEWHWLFLSHLVLPQFSSLFLSSRCYRCHCPPQFDGPDCQQTRLSFLGNGYAWFPPIRPCFDSHLSLEFMTDKEDGLLLYTGPLASLLPGEAEDYMAIGKECDARWWLAGQKFGILFCVFTAERYERPI